MVEVMRNRPFSRHFCLWLLTSIGFGGFFVVPGQPSAPLVEAVVLLSFLHELLFLVPQIINWPGINFNINIMVCSALDLRLTIA